MKRSRFRFTPLQAALHLAALVPFAWLLIDAANGNLSVNPIQEASRRTGLYALVMLLLSLAVTPLNTLTGYGPLVKMRRPLGLYAFFYAAVHLTIFIAIDYGFEWRFILPEISEKRYIIVGLSAFTILLALALTSFQWAMKKMGKNWKRLHRLVYLAAPLVILHFAWAVKGDLALLSGEVVRPVLYGLVALTLLATRLSPVRSRLAQFRQQRKRARRPAVQPPAQPSPLTDE